ncbi:CRISPR-associated endonuclease/helicase Cas3 [Arcticibacter pallidicorallinus]|uniref:CRISPR-associated endonuclease/helicase Cas3 n=2 Tax=Arcticibacter pallidicorallinus TaxID=1259464 RepID=A0A2T0TT68_9SPHI|nr:CRISPR-associated endonuclease/helicase Cas3 [Arcticibacter pallidicorallinus]
MAAIPDLSEWLPDVSKYLAHTKSSKLSETLNEHISLVNSYFTILVEEHFLDNSIDALIHEVIKLNKIPQISIEIVGNYLKEAFAYTICFHDFGKVNINFQADPLKMNNPLFKLIRGNPLGSNHSTLGAYLFILKQIQKHQSDNSLLPIEKRFVDAFSIVLSYSIFKHHSPTLSEPLKQEINFGNNESELKKYLSIYQLGIDPRLAEVVPLNLERNYLAQIDNILKSGFPLFTLLKLNFSLLTASDYLATHEYVNDCPTYDFGVFKSRERVEKLIDHLQNYQHNKAIYKDAEQADHFAIPMEKSSSNLNLIRRKMAAELIQTLRQNLKERLFYIEAPTGGGKTNLSMIAVSELLRANPEINKVYYVFPFTSLITQTCQALKASFGFEENELAELHSKAGFSNIGEADADGYFGDAKKDFISRLFAFYPVTVLSHIRFFDILKTNQKESNYLLHRLANSVVVVDELQSYNPEIWDKLMYFISEYSRFFNIRFILMSATLPKIGDIDLLSDYKNTYISLLPNASRYLRNPNFSERVNFRFDYFEAEISLDELAEVVIRKSEEYRIEKSETGSVRTIIEFIFKKSASEFYEAVMNLSHPFDQVLLLSGTVLEARRKEIINTLKLSDKTLNILLITTQVVEAGVDIDMDLGFKNRSLIDSDEQLAGRVNRNANKAGCEVYLFNYNDAKALHHKDLRFKITRENIGRSDYERILKEKDFGYLYNQVISKIIRSNNRNYADNLSSYQSSIAKLNYKDVDKKFRIIDQDNVSVFVPLTLPVKITVKETTEAIFSKCDLDLLSRLNAYFGEAEVNGKLVWEAYKEVIHNRTQGFSIEDKTRFKHLQSILSKFCFSLISYSSDVKKIQEGFGREEYGYVYFSHWDEERSDGRPYSLEAGLNTKAFSDSFFI